MRGRPTRTRLGRTRVVPHSRRPQAGTYGNGGREMRAATSAPLDDAGNTASKPVQARGLRRAAGPNIVAMTGRHVAAVACVGALAVVVGSASTRAASPSRSPARVASSPVAAVQPVAGARVVGHGTARSCTSSAVVAAVRAGGRIRFSCGSKPVTIRMRATAKVLNSRREVVLDGGGHGHAQRRGPAPHPLHGHLRPRPGVHDLALPGPGDAAARRREPHVRGRELHRRGLRRRRRRRDLRARRAAAHRPLDVRPATAAIATGPTSGGGAVRALSQYRYLPVQVVGSRFTGQRVQQRRRAEQHRRVVERRGQPLRPQPRDRTAARTRRGPARPAAAAAARSTTTATASSSRSPTAA